MAVPSSVHERSPGAWMMIRPPSAEVSLIGTASKKEDLDFAVNLPSEDGAASGGSVKNPSIQPEVSGVVVEASGGSVKNPSIQPEASGAVVETRSQRRCCRGIWR
eukprot:TRINITY_DN21381_c0_g1_i4.p2 TRINITY_DN21381_c0_g1~~TRINITY_DN21381_c0_g1_i4.p2  ORF type:complete len:115 (+),score=23.83 TRINITY_DN21381_c0_g1_i4:32-346(+)